MFNNYFNILDKIFFTINRSIEDRLDPAALLNGPVCMGGIRSNY